MRTVFPIPSLPGLYQGYNGRQHEAPIDLRQHLRMFCACCGWDVELPYVRTRKEAAWGEQGDEELIERLHGEVMNWFETHGL